MHTSQAPQEGSLKIKIDFGNFYKTHTQTHTHVPPISELPKKHTNIPNMNVLRTYMQNDPAYYAIYSTITHTRAAHIKDDQKKIQFPGMRSSCFSYSYTIIHSYTSQISANKYLF